MAAVMDGAEWQQGFVDDYRQDAAVATQPTHFGFHHAAQRIVDVGQGLFGEGAQATHQWIEPRLHQLKHDGPTAILAELRQLLIQHSQNKLMQENLAYLEKCEAQMQYPRFQELGWPIGSGCVESANELVVEAWLKGAGMHR